MTKRRRASPRPWTPADEDLLRRLYPATLTARIATALGRATEHVYSKANKLGLRKSEAFFARDLSGRALKGGSLSVATQFQPGGVPWNKGKSYHAMGRSITTQFKPGIRPHTWKPIGTLRINSEGLLQRKVSDTGYPPRDWVSLHRIVWEAAHGPVPRGHLVVFKPRRHSTDPERITLDALECIDRRELMRRNSVHRHGPEIARLSQLRGALNRQINKRTEAQESEQQTYE